MKKLLIVVDFQNDFVNGSLGFDGAEKLENKIIQKISKYKDNNIIYTLDTHYENYMNTMEGKNLPVMHCIKNSEGWNLYGKLKDLLKDHQCFEKETFGSTKLFEYLIKNNYDSIELVGLVSNICIISNAIIAKTALPEAEIIVDASCTASFDDILNEKALDVMEGLQIKIINR